MSAVSWERVAFVGHSFTRRLHDFVRHSKNPSFGLKNCQFRFLARGGLHVHEILDLCQPLVDFQPQLIIIMAGDNDLGHGVQPGEVASQLVEVAKSLQRSCGADRVIIGQLMPRFWLSEHRYYVADYNALAAETNQLLQSLVREVEGLVFWVHNFVSRDPNDPNFCSAKRFFDADGVHLASNGHCLLLRSWGRALRLCRCVE